MDMRIPPLKIKIMPESNLLKSRILVRRLAVGLQGGAANGEQNSPLGMARHRGRPGPDLVRRGLPSAEEKRRGVPLWEGRVAAILFVKAIPFLRCSDSMLWPNSGKITVNIW